MEQKTIITSDSTCDLPASLCERYNIHKYGLWVNLGDKTMVDDGTINNWDMYKYTRETGKLPKSAARSIPDYTDFFKSFTDKGYQVVHINISSELSVSYQNATLAAAELPNVCTVDSRLLSSGQGILAIRCAEKAKKNVSADSGGPRSGLCANISASVRSGRRTPGGRRRSSSIRTADA